MTGNVNDTALRDYLDALLQESEPPRPETTHGDPKTIWQLCKLGRLQLLLPGDAVGAPINANDHAAASAVWHHAHVRIDAEDWRVLELARCITPGLPCAAADTLLPVTGDRWMLAVPGRPVPMHLPNVAIEWRTQRNSRPWLAGMNRDGRHMVLDVRALIAHASRNADTTYEEPSP